MTSPGPAESATTAIASGLSSASTAALPPPPSLKLGLLLAFTSERAVARAQACGAMVVLPEVGLLREALIGEVGEAGLELIVWGFNPEKHATLLGDERVAGVITDDVAGTLAAQEQRI